MSTRDEATLSDAERAALAGLETKAEADDPRLAAQLRGRHRTRPRIKVPPVLVRASHSMLGPVITAVGLILAVLTLSVSVPLALLGALLLVVGLVMSSVLVTVEIERRRELLVPPTSPGSDRGEGPLSSL
jgi:hypothetical protein